MVWLVFIILILFILVQVWYNSQLAQYSRNLEGVYNELNERVTDLEER